MIKLSAENKDFYTKIFNLAIPIALQNLVMSALNLVDTVMIGQLGETQIASVALANQYYFLLSLFLFGVGSGCAIFHAQFWGKKDIQNIRSILGLSLLCGGLAATLFTIGGFWASKQILGFFTHDQQVITIGSSYLRIVCLSYVITAISYCFAIALRTTGNVKLPMVISMAAFSTNTVLNYLLIFGKFGFPALGVEGAAIATVIARLVEIVLTLLFVYGYRLVPAASLKELFDLPLELLNKFHQTTFPVILNETFWSAGITMYSVIYARMGTNVVAAANISATVEKIAMVLFVGMANASAVILGNKIGEGDEKTAFLYSKKLAILGPAIGIIMGAILILSSSPILSIYNVSEEVYNNAKTVLMIFAIFMPLKIFNLINIVGILRSGGDTKFSLFIDTVGVWFVAVPLAFLSGLVWSLPLPIVYIMIKMEDVFKFILGVKRFISGKWINNLVSEA